MRRFCFPWRREYSRILGIVYRPVAEVEIRGWPDGWIAIIAYVDSGADISLFPRRVGEALLGLKIEEGKEHLLRGIGGEPLKSYVHDIQMRLGDKDFKARAAFAETNEVPHLLGRMDVFDVFDVFFDHKRRQTCFATG